MTDLYYTAAGYLIAVFFVVLVIWVVGDLIQEWRK